MAVVEVTEAALGKAFDLVVGDELVLRLPENPTTVFRWQASASGDGELRLTSDRFEPGGAAPLPGAAGHRVLTFAASRPGAVTLALAQRRSWEPVAGPSKEVRVIVRPR